MKLKRSIGLFGIICASLGGMVGSGWLFGSLYAAQMAGPASMISWLIGGVSIMFLALTFAELSAMFPISGGVAAFPIFTHGKLVGFILTWITWITYVVSISQEVQSTILYMGNKFPSLIQKVDGVNVFTTYGYLICFVTMLILILLNSFGAKFLANANNFISMWKLLVPFAVVFLFLITRHNFGNMGLTTDSAHEFAPYGVNGIFSAVALAGVVYSFCGFQHAALLAGESKRPQRDIPLALILSILICIALYCGLQYAFITALPETALANGYHNLSFAGDAGPLAGLAATLGIVWLVTVLYVDAIISPLGTGVLYVASSARIVQTMSQSGNSPKFFAKIAKSGIPMRAIFLNLAVSMLAFLPFSGWKAIVSFLSSALVFSFAVGPICLIALRKQQPERKRPFSLPFYKVVSFIAFFVCNLMIYWSGWDVVWKLGVTVITGFVVFVISNYLSRNTIDPEHVATKLDYKCSIWLLPYMAIFCILSYYSSFTGGQKVIPIGWDFLIIALFSLFIFYLALKMCLPKEESDKNTASLLAKKGTN
ncbi:amino acid permease [Silvanigrella paludirubra]|uniref:Amino acid permease n=1 Tax=Silvanigrella paludirubra TaxID=2499159 RepID=A0A6N6VWU1_9BACT|nr:APC family permease [Silvanigrella paludirubra]KAB8041110.1 amino acid permease [Silvanigrella paludirubra]